MDVVPDSPSLSRIPLALRSPGLCLSCLHPNTINHLGFPVSKDHTLSKPPPQSTSASWELQKSQCRASSTSRSLHSNFPCSCRGWRLGGHGVGEDQRRARNTTPMCRAVCVDRGGARCRQEDGSQFQLFHKDFLGRGDRAAGPSTCGHPASLASSVCHSSFPASLPFIPHRALARKLCSHFL